MEVSDKLHVPAALPPGKELAGPQSRFGRCGVERNRTPAVQPVASLYTD
jgi:hypothetical protein